MASSADTGYHLNAPQIFRHAFLTLKRMVVPITKSMLAHGQALWPCPTHAGRWEGITAFVAALLLVRLPPLQQRAT